MAASICPRAGSTSWNSSNTTRLRVPCLACRRRGMSSRSSRLPSPAGPTATSALAGMGPPSALSTGRKVRTRPANQAGGAEVWHLLVPDDGTSRTTQATVCGEPSAWFAQQQSTASEQFGKSASAERAQAARNSLVRDRPELFWHGEAPLAGPGFREPDLQMEGVREIGAREWDRERKSES
jgi:hypothetical protein